MLRRHVSPQVLKRPIAARAHTVFDALGLRPELAPGDGFSVPCGLRSLFSPLSSLALTGGFCLRCLGSFAGFHELRLRVVLSVSARTKEGVAGILLMLHERARRSELDAAHATRAECHEFNE
jgi:hypothetical protein